MTKQPFLLAFVLGIGCSPEPVESAVAEDLSFGPYANQNVNWSVHTPSGHSSSGAVLSGVNVDGWIVDRERPYAVRSADASACMPSVVLRNIFGASFSLSYSDFTLAAPNQRMSLEFAYPIDHRGPFEDIVGGEFTAEELSDGAVRVMVANGVHCTRENVAVEEVCVAQVEPLVLELSGALFARPQDFQIEPSTGFTHPNGNPMCTASVTW